MLTPDARREAVAHVCAVRGVSQRRACAALQVDRSSVRYSSIPPDDGGLRDARGLELAILARTRRFHQRTTDPVLERLGLQSCALTETEPDDDMVSIGTLHAAKGLEFRAVAVLGCDADMLPLRAAIAAEIGEDAQALAHDRERHLLYVGCTRARESLLLTHVGPPSPFLVEVQSATVG